MSCLSNGHAQDPARSLTHDFEQALTSVRTTRGDLALRPERWPTAFTLPSVESLLRDPLSLPDAALRLRETLRRPMTSADSLKQAADQLSIVLPPPYRSTQTSPLDRLTDTIAHAAPLLKRAVDSMTASDRAAVLATWTQVLSNQEGTSDLRQAVAAAKPFDQAALFQAARDIGLAVDEALPFLSEKRLPTGRLRDPRETAAGRVLITEGDEQTFTAEDLSSVTLLINFSRRSHYQAPVASADENQIRVVIDFAQDITVDEMPFSAGVGRFGIGLFYLPTSEGTKTIRTANQSQGFGLFGVGGFFASAAHSVFNAHDGAQGAAAFGAGLFCNMQGTASHYSVRFAGQGLGLTRGVGLFRHEGSDALIEGGLHYPDPREGLAFTSLCQGVGYGPRAFSAGGIGLASIKGNRNRIASSYFSQGSGYWHGLGECVIEGDDNHLQARRYGQGTGVHTAVGALILDGNRNQTINWGVGPAYGWDMGIGTFLATGDNNQFQTEWGSVHGEMNGHAMAAIQGRGNRIALANIGSGTLNRQMPSYGLALIRGVDTHLRVGSHEMTIAGPFQWHSSAWGVLSSTGPLILDPALALVKPDWPVPDRSSAAKADRDAGQKALARANALPIDQKLTDWIAIAAQPGLDGSASAEALHRLYTLPRGDLPRLVQSLAPDHFDHWIAVRNIWSSYGAAGVPSLLSGMTSDSVQNVMVMNLMFGSAPDLIYSTLVAKLRDPDWRVRKVSCALLGTFADIEEGASPGRLTLLKRWRAVVAKTQDVQTVGQFYLIDAFSVLALDPAFSVDDRLKMLDAVGDPFSPLRADALKVFGSLLDAHAEIYGPALDGQIAWADHHRAELRKQFRSLLGDQDLEVRLTALTALANLGEASDAETVAAFLSDPSAVLREGAAAALGKMGPAAAHVIEKEQKSSSADVRAIAALSAAQSWDPSVVRLMSHAWADRDERVQLVALSALPTVLPGPKTYKADFEKDISLLTQKPASPSINAAAFYVLSLLND